MPTSHIAYLRRWTVYACLIVLAAAATNLLVDPYGIYDIARIDGLNGFKSRAAQRGSQFKRHLLQRLRPAAVVLGNSRAEVGFDPQHPAFLRAGAPVVNLALPGTGIGTTVEFLRNAIDLHPPRIAVIGLDFLDARTTGDPPEARNQPGTTNPVERAWWQWAADHVDALISMDSFYDSLRTLRDNRRDESPGLTAQGFNPMRDYRSIARSEGYHQLFLQRDTENARSYARGPKAVFVRGTRTSPYFEAVRTLVASCRQAGIELHLVIYPYHAHILELFHATGLWESFEEWKRGLTGILLEESDGATAQTPIRLWDFSGYSEFAAERVPPSTDRRTQMRWYWEAGHFKKELGDVVLERILAPPAATQGPATAFGVLLTDRMLEEHLARIRAGRASYRRDHAEEVAALEEVARAAGRRQVPTPEVVK